LRVKTLKNIFTKIAATAATGAILSVAIAIDSPKANAASLTRTPLIVDDDGS
jgi:hypothetical protein